MKRRELLKNALLAGGAASAGSILAGSSALTAREGWTPPFNVRLFGAKGDGVADDTAAIQAAIKAAIAARAAAVYIPAGQYRVGRSLRVESAERIDLFGDGASSVLLHESDEPVFLWPEGISCRESSVRQLCITSVAKPKSPGTAAIYCGGGAERSLFSHLLFTVGAGEGGGPAHMGSGIHTEQVMDTTTVEHCLMWGPVRGTGISVARGSEVRIIGGRILGAGDPGQGISESNIGIHLQGGNGGVHVVTTDLIGLGTAIKIGEEGAQSNREVFITHATIDSSHHGIVQVDHAYTSIAGCWAASCDEEQVLLAKSASGALLCISGGTIFNGGAYGRPGNHHGLVVRAGSFSLTGVMVRHNKGTGILVEGDGVKDYSITGCRITDNGMGAVLGGSGYAVTGNVFARNGVSTRRGDDSAGLVGQNVGV